MSAPDYYAADQVCRFNCLGEVTFQDSTLGNSFLKNNAIKKLFETNANTKVLPPKVILFRRQWDADLIITLDIFKICWKNYLMIYEHALMTDSCTNGTSLASVKIDSDLRSEICSFMNHLDNYLAKCQNHPGSPKWIPKKMFLNFSRKPPSLWHGIKNISVLPNNIIYSGSAVEDKCFHAGFHLLHLHLELVWYKLVILYRLEQLATIFSLQDVSVDVNEEIQNYVNLLVQDLFTLAVSKFEKVGKLLPEEMKRKTPFPCSCFKETWILIQIFLDKHYKDALQNKFWTCVNNLCSRLYQPIASDMQIDEENKILCSNPVLFSLWFLYHMGHLYSYSENGEFIGPSSCRMVSNYILLEKILKILLSRDVVSELQLRSCLPYITDLMVDLWPPQRETVCKLWEHFHHHLNTCFFLPGAAAATIASNCTSSSEILSEVNHIIYPCSSFGLVSGKYENSFHLFLRLLGKVLLKNPQLWSSIKGRIFSKFSQAKMQTLKEMGLLNFSLLFLCMAIVGHTKEVGDKMQDFLRQATTVSLDLGRRLMIWKAHLALLQVYIKKEIDINESSVLLMEDVNYICSNKHPDSVALLNAFTRGLQDIIESSKTLDYSEYKLIGSWINSYLKLAAEPSRLVNILSYIITKILSLSKNIGMIEYNASESHFTKMYLAICKHLLPYIKEKFAISDSQNSCSQMADLAVKITLLALNRTNVGVSGTSVPHLFESFAVNAHPLNAKLSVRYVCVLMQEEGILPELMDNYDNYEALIIQTWLRCSVYSFKENDDEFSQLTQIVCKLPTFQILKQKACVDIESQIKPVDSFIAMLGHLLSKMDSLEERSEFREQCVIYLTPTIKSFERMLRNKDADEKIICRIYEVAALLIMQCGTIIYSKTQPYCLFNSLVNTLLLPMAVLKPGAEMPPSMLYAIQRTFPSLVKGLIKLNCASGNSLSPIIKNVITRYFPRLVGKTSVTSQEASRNLAPRRHPLLLCFYCPDEDSEVEVSKSILEIISQSFLKAGDSQCMNALMFLLEVLQETKFNDNIVKMFIDLSLSQVFEVIILGDNSMLVAKRHAFHLLKEVFHNKINNSNFFRNNVWTVLWTLIQKHVILNSVNIMSLLSKMCEISPLMMMGGLQQIKEMINSPTIFHRANVAKTLRIGVENMEKLLDLSKQIEM